MKISLVIIRCLIDIMILLTPAMKANEVEASASQAKKSDKKTSIST